MLLLTAVTLFSAVVALLANWWEGPRAATTKAPVYVAAQAPVRVVGAPFVPNLNPRARQ